MTFNRFVLVLLLWFLRVESRGGVVAASGSKDYCVSLMEDGIQGMPKKRPETAVVVKSSHPKNVRGFELMCKELNISLKMPPPDGTVAVPKEGVDIVWSPFYPVETLSNRLTIFGPEFDIFPGDPSYSGWKVPRDTEGHAFYDVLSDWNRDVHAGMGGWKYPMVSLKFPVDVERFRPLPSSAVKKHGGFIYFKRRQPELLEKVKNFLETNGLMKSVEIFDYVERYHEKDFLAKLRTAAWGIWIGTHESQGFGLQETLSMNVPLIILNAENMRDEGGGCPGGPFCYLGPEVNLNATTATSWSPLCGEIVVTFEEFVDRWDMFQKRIANKVYNPREMIMKTVAPKPCAMRLMQLYNVHRNNWCEQYIAARDRPNEPKKDFYNMSLTLCLAGKQLF